VETWGELNCASGTTVAHAAWLAGILDGEGCLTVKQSKTNSIACVVTIETVSTSMIRRVEEILQDCGIAYCTEGPMLRPRSTRPSIRIRVHRKQAVLDFCDLVLPFSVVKQSELLLFKGYLEKACLVTYFRPTENDLQFIPRMKELKRLA
jgi:hypothetical protein